MPAWFRSKKPDHPMADMKKARQLVRELAQKGPIKALDDAASSIESILGTEGFKLEQRLALIDLLDQGVKTHHMKLEYEYLNTPRMQKPYENRLWNTCFGFWKTLGSGYLKCMEQFQAGAAGSAAIKKELPVVTGRALRSLAVQIKWILLRYGLIEDRIWRDLGRVYLFAENQGVAEQRTAIYPGLHGESSGRDEFLKALMLVMSSPDSLAPARLHIAERLVAHFGEQFALQPNAGPGCKFIFDLAMHKPPARGRAEAGRGSMLRFFGAGPAAQAVRDLSQEIKRTEGVPAAINLGGEYNKGSVLSVLDHLSFYWADKPPVRTSQRRDIATRVTVVPGFPEITRWIEAAMDANSLEFTGPEISESWIVHNVSDGGYGAIVPEVKGDWLHIGNLLGLQPETSSIRGVGVIRRVTRDQYGQRRVGIRFLSRVAIPMTLAYADNKGAIDAGHAGNSALLLSSKPDKNGQIAVLMAAGGYSPTQHFQMSVQNKNYLLSPAAMIEGGEDFDWARFKVLKQI